MTERTRLSVEGLRVVTRRSRAPVVEDVSFSVESGKTVGLVGESGSGKTTVALALLGYARRGLELAGGRVLVDGDDVLAMRPDAVRKLRGARVAYVPQDPSTALNPALKVGTQLHELLAKYDDEAGLGEERVHEVLTDVRLDAGDVLGSYPHQLSGGQQQRLALAMAFLLRPAVIVLDEPTTALDVTTQRHVLNTIRSLCGVHGVASVFVSHDLAVIGELVDHVAVLYAGSIVERGPTAAVLGEPTHPYTRGLLKAIPSPTRRYPLVGLPGQPPRPREGRWSACAFAPRCEYAADKCLAGGPALELLNGNEHAVRCVRWPELPPPRARVEEGVNGHGSAVAQALAVRGIKASYGGVEVLHGVDFELDRRSCLAVVGESGSGKTTLARCLVGMHRRWEGDVMLYGEPLARSLRDRPKEALRTMQYIFQSPYASLNPRRTVREIVEQPLRYFFDLSRDERSARVATALEDAALDSSFEPRLPSELSGGERQRVAIARALAAEPDILVCDEITSALDVSVQAAIIETLRRLQEERELAVVFITHNLALVKSVAQHVVVMCEGAVVEAGITDDVLARPEAEYTRRLISDVPKPRVSAFQPG